MFCCCLGKKLSTLISCEQALHLGDKVKTGRARGTREETRKRGVGVVGGCPRAALFVRPNRRACSQASTLRTLLPLASGSSHDPPPPPPHPFPSNVVRKDNLLAPFLLACSRLRDGGEKSFSNTKCEKRHHRPLSQVVRLIFALLVLIRSHYTIWEPGTGYLLARNSAGKGCESC